MEKLPITASNPVPVIKVRIKIPTESPKGNGRGMSGRQKSPILVEPIMCMA